MRIFGNPFNLTEYLANLTTAALPAAASSNLPSGPITLPIFSMPSNTTVEIYIQHVGRFTFESDNLVAKLQAIKEFLQTALFGAFAILYVIIWIPIKVALELWPFWLAGYVLWELSLAILWEPDYEEEKGRAMSRKRPGWRGWVRDPGRVREERAEIMAERAGRKRFGSW